MPSLTDEEIASRVQRGSRDDFGILMERYEAKMLRYAHKFLFGYDEAEDLVQEVFLKAYINIQSFNIKRRFSPWLYRIAHNEFLNAIKKKGKEPLPFFDPDTLFPHPIAAATADSDLHKQELRSELDQYLGKLDARYREPLVLYFFEEMSYREIADILQIPVSTVGVRLKRGLDYLRKFYK